ncbi:hypothetical protein DRH27_02285 [Candidatus Falkowbacteria bacterium]|nr:MAG: hypothetical protein DRH27_02285 [Candidatus Falkowbacteria bacterium]
MKRKKTVILIALTVSMFLLTMPTIAFSKSAEKLIKNAVLLSKKGSKMEARGVFAKAKNQIIEELSKNPNNIEANYASALYQFYSGNLESANNRFELVYTLSQGKKGKEIFNFYQKESQEAMLNHNWKRYINLSVASYKFIHDSSRKKLAANNFYTLGKNWLNKGEYHIAKKYFIAAKTLDASYSSKNANAFIQSANSQNSANAKLILLSKALEMDTSLEKEITQKTGLYLKKNKIKKAQITKELNQFPGKIIPIISKIAWPPDYIECGLGPSRSFILKPGEFSPYLKGQKNANQIFQSKYGKYKVCFRNGKCYSPDKVPAYSLSDFRFQGITNCDVRAFFKQ